MPLSNEARKHRYHTDAEFRERAKQRYLRYYQKHRKSVLQKRKEQYRLTKEDKKEPHPYTIEEESAHDSLFYLTPKEQKQPITLSFIARTANSNRMTIFQNVRLLTKMLQTK